MTRGLLLFAHGARDPRWAEPFEAVAASARRRAAETGASAQVVLGFLEFMQPDLLGAGDALAAGGCAQVDVVPLFLGAGGHVRKDLPGLMDRLREQHATVQWTLRPAIGESPAVVEAMATVSMGWLLPASDTDGPVGHTALAATPATTP